MLNEVGLTNVIIIISPVSEQVLVKLDIMVLLNGINAAGAVSNVNWIPINKPNGATSTGAIYRFNDYQSASSKSQYGTLCC